MQSRRTFIGNCAAGLAALGSGPLRVFGSDGVGLAEYRNMVGTVFYLASYSGTEQGQVKLLAVEELSSGNGLDQFNLRFIGRPGVSLPEGLYGATNWRGHPYFDIHVQPTRVDRWGRVWFRASFAQLL